jgi:bacillolysin
MRVLSFFLGGLLVTLLCSRRKTRAEGGQVRYRRSTEHTLEVLRVNDKGTPTVVAGDLGDVGTHANDDVFRDNVKQQLTNLLQVQVGGEWTIADASSRDLEAQGRSKISKNGYAHVRFIQRVNGYPVEGASLVAHTNADGKIFLVNGEFLTSHPVPSKPILDSKTAVSLAMKEAGISFENLRDRKTLRGAQDAELAMVIDEHDNVCFAWKTLVDYVEINDDDSRIQMKALIYANTQNGRLCALHPQIFDLDPIIRTYSCTPDSFFGQLASIHDMDCRYLHADSPTQISTGQSALDAAHNNALTTYQYYKDYHGLESVDDRNTPIKSHVLSTDFKFESAFWDRGTVVFGDGKPPPAGGTNPYSTAIDVVAHEFVSQCDYHTTRLDHHSLWPKPFTIVCAY